MDDGIGSVDSVSNNTVRVYYATMPFAVCNAEEAER